MIREIRIRNLALIDDLSLSLESGFTVFTGETGAGKSILIGAIGLLLGDRAQSEHIRQGTDEAEIEGVLELPWVHPDLKKIMDSAGIALDDGPVIIRRIISRTGRNRIYVNQVAVVLATLRTIGNHLIDLHGQHDHQSLLNPDTARTIVDSLSEVVPHVDTYRKTWEYLSSSRERYETFERTSRQQAEQREFTEFRLKEISSLNLKTDEEPELEAEMSLLSSTTDRVQCAQSVVQACTGEDGGGIVHLTMTVKKNLERLSRLDESVKPWLDDLENARTVFDELESFASRYIENAGESVDPGRLEKINERLARIQRLKKKHSCSFNDLLQLQKQLAEDLAKIANFEADRTLLKKTCDDALASCRNAANALRKHRKKAAARFDHAVTENLQRLGFKDGQLRTEFAELAEPGPHGLENSLFMVRTNEGEPFLALSKTASGGEISRLMLAMKTVLAQEDPVPVLIFDEVDAGIGGMVAREVAESLYALSARQQVLCISHLHQIASLADQHIHVYKQTESGRTVTGAVALGSEERVEEIARMLGGKSEIARSHARELLERHAKK